MVNFRVNVKKIKKWKSKNGKEGRKTGVNSKYVYIYFFSISTVIGGNKRKYVFDWLVVYESK